MRKIIISLAPVVAGAPLNYNELTLDIVKSIDVGASMCHLHSRNGDGELTPNPSEMFDCFERVLKQRDVIVQASTGGISNMNIEERCHPLNSDIVESCSLNGGSTNLGEQVYINSFEDIRYVASVAKEKKILPEIEVFDIGMIQAVEKLIQSRDLGEKKLYNLVFGHPGGMQPTVDSLIAFRAFVPENCLWGVTHFGRVNWDFLACAITMGATIVRIGFEDSLMLSPEIKSSNNYELVERLRQLIESVGYSVATVDEARSILEIPNRKEN